MLRYGEPQGCLLISFPVIGMIFRIGLVLCWYGFGIVLALLYGSGMVWVWFWYGFGIIFVWFWYGFGIMLFLF